MFFKHALGVAHRKNMHYNMPCNRETH